MDDHRVISQGLRDIIDASGEFQCWHETLTLAEARAAFAARLPPLALIDLRLPDATLSDVEYFVSNLHNCRVLIYTASDAVAPAARLLARGVPGYVLKTDPTSELLLAMRRVAAGGTFISTRMAQRLIDEGLMPVDPGHHPGDPAGFGRLSEREVEVFRCLGQGLRVDEIARTLGLSAKTVHAHRDHIKDKLGVSSTQELQERARAWWVRNRPGAPPAPPEPPPPEGLHEPRPDRPPPFNGDQKF